MGKRIVFCADGTWDGTSSSTNVFKMFNATLVSSTQMPFYDNGVGADGTPLEKLTGGAFGLGIFQKIKDGYTKISQVYDADDEIGEKALIAAHDVFGDPAGENADHDRTNDRDIVHEKAPLLVVQRDASQ